MDMSQYVVNMLYYIVVYDLCAIMYTCVIFFFFFFKQKTAYEMRISDWSSDVCSSDLSRALYLHRRDLDPERCPDQRLGPIPAQPPRRGRSEIGRASCRERVCQYV